MKLFKLICAIKKTLPENTSVVNTFASDGDCYFIYSDSDKWRRKLVRLQPEQRKVSVIDLPDYYDMKNS